MSIEHTCEHCDEEYDIRHEKCPACGTYPSNVQKEIGTLRAECAKLREENERLRKALRCIGDYEDGKTTLGSDGIQGVVAHALAAWDQAIEQAENAAARTAANPFEVCKEIHTLFGKYEPPTGGEDG